MVFLPSAAAPVASVRLLNHISLTLPSLAQWSSAPSIFCAFFLFSQQLTLSDDVSKLMELVITSRVSASNSLLNSLFIPPLYLFAGKLARRRRSAEQRPPESNHAPITPKSKLVSHSPPIPRLFNRDCKVTLPFLLILLLRAPN